MVSFEFEDEIENISNEGKEDNVESVEIPSWSNLSDTSQCHGTLKLSSYQGGFPNQIFMMETSGATRLKPRQACTVESAALNTGLPVVMLMAAEAVDLSDVTTCNLVKNVKGVYFRRLAPEIVFEGMKSDICMFNIYF